MGKPVRAAPARVGWERMHHPLLPWPAFVVRLLRSLALAAALIAVSLFAGMAGYHWLEHLGWLDSYLNAAMLLSGMGPLWSPISEAGKVFAGLYALYSGVAVLAFAGVIIAPIGHRLLHRFHAEEEPGEAAPDPQRPAPRNAKK
jgi:hypothetical protein